MINKVTVINYTGQQLVMELRHPEKSGFLVYNMTGIGPEKAEIRTTDIVTSDGGFYNSSRLPARNIVMNLLFSDWTTMTIEQIRHESYKYFPIKKQITIKIEGDDRISEITGYVESNEPVMFSSQCYTQLSIICPQPMFYDGGPNGFNTTIFSGVEPAFEFPFENDSLTEPLLIMGEIKNRSEELVNYTGDSEIGVIITIDATGPVDNIIIHNVLTRERMIIDTTIIKSITGSSIIAGDRIEISTVTGDKYIRLLRNGVYTNILNSLGKNISWFQLSKGDNIFAFESETGQYNLFFRMRNRIFYEGV